jgi:hypothetical protein
MPLSREIRRLQNIKELSISSGDTKITGSHAPSSLNMRDGEMVFAQESNKPLSMYKKYKGMLWKSHMSRDGNQFVDKNLEVKGKTTLGNDLTVSGELKGTRLIFNFGTAAASDTDFYMKTVNGVTMSSNLGYVMHRAGSIVGAGARFQCTSFSSTDTWSVDVLVNNASVFKPTGIYVDDTGYYSTYGTQARGTDTFVVGNLIQVKMNATAGSRATIDNVIGYFEVVFDD